MSGVVQAAHVDAGTALSLFAVLSGLHQYFMYKSLRALELPTINRQVHERHRPTPITHRSMRIASCCRNNQGDWGAQLTVPVRSVRGGGCLATWCVVGVM